MTRRITDQKARETASMLTPNDSSKSGTALFENAKLRGKSFFYAMVFVALVCIFFIIFFPDLAFNPIQPRQNENTILAVNYGGTGNEESLGLDELSDYSAIYIPTKRNYRTAAFEPPMPEGWDMETGKSTKVAKDLFDIKFTNIDAIGDVEDSKISLLRSTMRHAFSAMGISEKEPEISEKEFVPNLQITDMKSGNTVAEEFIRNTKALPAPLVFQVQIFNDGYISTPVTIISSGDDKYDNLLKSDFVNSQRAKNLDEGFYRISVYP